MPDGDLLLHIFGNVRLPLAGQFAAWVQESPRFRAFAETYRDKIRKKVRGITEAEGYRDLEAELAAAYYLALERRFLVEYESYGVAKQRGPDFSVTFKTHLRFDVEVSRLRGEPTGAVPEPSKLVNTLCAKLPQLRPGLTNLLILTADHAPYSAEDLTGALRLLHERAEHKDDEFFSRRGFLGARDFLKHYRRLSAIRLTTPGAAPVLWLYPQARHPLAPDLVTLLRR